FAEYQKEDGNIYTELSIGKAYNTKDIIKVKRRFNFNVNNGKLILLDDFEGASTVTESFVTRNEVTFKDNKALIKTSGKDTVTMEFKGKLSSLEGIKTSYKDHFGKEVFITLIRGTYIKPETVEIIIEGGQ
nr:hypothetical protein [Lachnospiraceae bacterium]